MNRLLSKILIGMLAVAMTTGGVYGSTDCGSTDCGSASGINGLTEYGSTGGIFQSIGGQSLAEEKTDDTEESFYEEGQAIVLLNPYDKGVSAKSLDDEYDVTDTLEFVTGESDASAADYSSETGGDSESGEAAFSAESLPEGTKLKLALVESSKLTTEQLIDKLEDNSDVVYAVPNVKLKVTAIDNDMTDLQWSHENRGQNNGTPGASMNVDSEWKDKNNTGDKEKVVAVLDSGIDYTHADLAPNMWHNTHKPRLAGEYGYDFVNGDDDPMDDCGHGTHCAGIIGAVADEKGVTGICPDVSLMAVKIASAYGASDIWAAFSGYEYVSRAQDEGVNVVAINNSYGNARPIDNSDKCDLFADELRLMKVIVDTVGAKGAVSVFAAGNDAWELGKDAVSTPTQVDSDYAVTVAAANEKDEIADFSTYGSAIDVAAPGTDILSTVSYPIYNPGIYDAEEQDVCSAEYTDFSTIDEKWENYLESFQDNIRSDEGVTVDAEITDEEYFGLENGKSLKISVHADKAGSAMVRLPEYDISDVQNYDTQTKVCSFMLRSFYSQADAKGTMYFMIKNDSNCITLPITNHNSWTHVQMLAAKRDIESSKSSCIGIMFKLDAPGDYGIYIDDYGIARTVENANAADILGKYDYMNGTSMAAPHVTGEAALLAAAKTAEDGEVSYDAYDTIESIYSHLRKADFDKPIATGCSVDLSKNEPYLNPGKRYDRMKDAKDTPDWDSVITDGSRLYSMKDGAISMIKLKDNPSMKSELVYTIGSTDEESNESGVGSGGNAGSNESGGASDGDAGTTDLGGASASNDKGLSESKYYRHRILPASNMAVCDGKLYIIVNDAIYHLIYEDNVVNDKDIVYDRDGEVFSNDYKLYEIDPAKAASNENYKPEMISLDKSLDNLDDITLAAYNGNLMFLGGYNYNDKKPSTSVTVYSPADGKWTAGAAMPDGQGRADGYALQTDSGLVYTMGYSEAQKGVAADEQKCPANLVFDGSKWRVSSAKLNLTEKPAQTVKDGETYNSYSGSVSYADGGLVYIAMPAEGMTDTFTYSVRDDKFASTEYNMNKYPDKYKSMTGVATFDKVICQAPDGLMYEFPISSGLVAVKDLSGKGSAVSGTGVSVVPGSKVTLKASAKKGYYVKSLAINGKITRGKSATIRVTDGTQTAKSVAARYVTKVKLNKTKLTLKAGKTYKLKATVYPKDAGNKVVRYTTSNKRYATVSKTGKVKALKAGKGKTVTIRAIARDGSGKKATCKVRIK